MLEEQSIKDFSAALMSKSPVPGGGGVSALAGALAACLGGMATNLTIGKRKFIPVEPMLREKLQMLIEYRDALLRCMQEDAEAFEPLSKAYGMPAETSEEKQRKQEVLERCLWQAAQPPMRILELGAAVVETLEALKENISKLVQSDLGCAAAMARACAHCAVMNVWINAQLMQEKEKAQQLYEQSNGLLIKTVQSCDAMVQKVEETLWQH